MEKNKISQYLHDIGKAAGWGLLAGGIIFILFLAGGFLVSGFDIFRAANILRSGMLIITGIGLFLVAALLLTKKGTVSEDNKEKWKKQFYKLHYTGVILVICLIFVLYAAAADYWVILLR